MTRFISGGNQELSKLFEEIQYDLGFVKSHTLQPKWYKVLKIFILIGFITGYWSLFGWLKTAIFLIIFFALMLVIHLIYRTKTNRFTRSWLDFSVENEDGAKKAKSIGKFYYLSIIINAMLSITVSQFFP